jgi:hypothetical protein
MKYLLAKVLSAIGLSQHFIWKMGLPYEKDWFERWYGLPRWRMGVAAGVYTDFITDETYLKFLCECEPGESQLEWFKKSAQFVSYGGGFRIAPAFPGVKIIRVATAEEFMQISILNGYKLIETGSMLPMGRDDNYECWYNSEKDDAVMRYVKHG